MEGCAYEYIHNKFVQVFRKKWRPKHGWEVRDIQANALLQDLLFGGQVAIGIIDPLRIGNNKIPEA